MDESLNKRLILLEEKLESSGQDDLNKTMYNSGLGGAGSVSRLGMVLPNKISKPKMSNNSLSSKVKIPSIAQPSKKNPIKSIQQIHNKDIKDIKMKEALSHVGEVIKALPNGQWELEKAKVITRKPGETTGMSSDERSDAEAKQAQKDLEQQMKDPDFKLRALQSNLKDAQAKKRQQQEKDEIYDKAVETDDPDAKPPVATKKKTATFIAQFNRRKEAPDKKLIAKEGSLVLKKTEESIDDRLDAVEEKLYKADLTSGKNLSILKNLKYRLTAKKELKEKNPSLDVDKLIPPPPKSKKMKKSRCWEGYEPTPGKKAYEKGSCQPIKKKECDCKNCDCDSLSKGISGKRIYTPEDQIFSHGSTLYLNKAVTNKETGETHGYEIHEHKPDGTVVVHANIPYPMLDQAMEYGDQRAQLRMSGEKSNKRNNLYHSAKVEIHKEPNNRKSYLAPRIWMVLKPHGDPHTVNVPSKLQESTPMQAPRLVQAPPSAPAPADNVVQFPARTAQDGKKIA